MSIRQIGQPVAISTSLSTQAEQKRAWLHGPSAIPVLLPIRHSSCTRVDCRCRRRWRRTLCCRRRRGRLLVVFHFFIAARCVITRLQSVRVRADAVTHGSQELESCVWAGVETCYTCLYSCFVHDVPFLLKTSDGKAVPQSSQVVHGIRRRVLQMSEECEHVGTRYLNSTSKCSMETFQDVVRSVPVVADAQSIGANRTLLNPSSAGIA